MRALIVLSALAILLSAPALAQDWQEYEYPDAGFAASFPAMPQITTAPYAADEGKSVSQTSYTVTQPARLYRVTVADYSGMTESGDDAINHAVMLWQGQGTVTVDASARVNREYGRQLSVTSRDGSRSVIAIFFTEHKLIQIQGTVRAGSADLQSGDAARFQQSLRFIYDGSGGRPLRF